MRIWTIQTSNILDVLNTDGVLRSNGICCDEDFAESYRWISGKLAEKIGPAPEGIVFPVWGWIRYIGKDFRAWNYSDNLDGKVLIEAEIPDELILASDFDEWHCVLNNIPHDCDKEACDEWERWIDSREGTCDPMPEHVRKLVERSWDGIFHSDGDTVQGIFWELRKEWIVRVKPMRQTLWRKIRTKLFY